MEAYSADFTLDVQGVKGVCPAGEAYAKQQMAAKKIPVLSCEGPCIRGEIARLAANLIADEVPSLARACHAETFFVPHSAMAAWVKTADRSIIVDGCFLKCHGRVLKELIGEDKVVQFDALSMYKKYTDVFRIDGVPEEERRAVARQVADTIIARLTESGGHHSPEEERRIREAALDDTIEGSFPASDPPSTDPNPDDHSATDRRVPSDTGKKR